MSKVNIYNEKGEVLKSLDLSKDIFEIELKQELIHQAMVTQMSNERQVLAHTKGRSEVRGGGKKPWKQKGTGRARSGSSRSPIWIGGGVTFGPTKFRNFSKNINKKMKRKALFMVLSDRVASNNLVVLDKITMTDYKTKTFNTILSNIEKNAFVKKAESKSETKDAKDSDKKSKTKPAKRSLLFVNSLSDEKVRNSGRNLTGVEIITLENINILDLLKYRNVVFTQEAIKKLEELYKK